VKNGQNHPSLREVISAYDRVYESSDLFRDSDVVYKWVLDKLSPRKESSLLDIAFGLGLLMKHAIRRNIFCTGIDLSMSVAAQVHRQLPGSRILVADGEKLPFPDQKFDYITNLGSLEHFINPSQGIQEMHRVLRKNGQAAILLPNSYYLLDIIQKVMLTGHGPTHHQIIERFATYHEWEELLEKYGLHVQASYKYNFFLPRNREDWSWFLKHPKRLIPPLIAPFIPYHLSFSFLYICTPL